MSERLADPGPGPDVRLLHTSFRSPLLSAFFKKQHQREKPEQAEVTGGAAPAAGGQGPDADLQAGAPTPNQARLCVKMLPRTKHTHTHSTTAKLGHFVVFVFCVVKIYYFFITKLYC